MASIGLPGLPDLRSRFGWLPRGNIIDPQIYTQLELGFPNKEFLL